MKKIRLGSTQKKILLLLMGGLAIGLSGNPIASFRIIKAIGEDWKKINNEALKESIRRLYRSKMIDVKENKDGSCTIILTGNGKSKALTYKLDEMQINQPSKWDG